MCVKPGELQRHDCLRVHWNRNNRELSQETPTDKQPPQHRNVLPVGTHPVGYSHPFAMHRIDPSSKQTETCHCAYLRSSFSLNFKRILSNTSGSQKCGSRRIFHDKKKFAIRIRQSWVNELARPLNTFTWWLLRALLLSLNSGSISVLPVAAYKCFITNGKEATKLQTVPMLNSLAAKNFGCGNRCQRATAANEKRPFLLQLYIDWCRQFVSTSGIYALSIWCSLVRKHLLAGEAIFEMPNGFVIVEHIEWEHWTDGATVMT